MLIESLLWQSHSIPKKKTKERMNNCLPLNMRIASRTKQNNCYTIVILSVRRDPQREIFIQDFYLYSSTYVKCNARGKKYWLHLKDGNFSERNIIRSKWRLMKPIHGSMKPITSWFLSFCRWDFRVSYFISTGNVHFAFHLNFILLFFLPYFTYYCVR